MNGLGRFPQTEGLDKNFHKRRDGGFGGFKLGRVAEIAEGLGGNGADGGTEDFRREGEAGGFKQREEIVGSGGTGEGDGVGPGISFGEEEFDLFCRAGRNDCAIGGSDGEFGSSGTERKRDGVAGGLIAGELGTDEEKTDSGFGMRKQDFCEGFGDGAWRDEVGLAAEKFFDGVGGCGTDGSDTEELCFPAHRKRRDEWGTLCNCPFVEGFDGVGAGEEEPVELVECGDGGVEGLEGGGVFEGDGGDEDGLGAEGTQAVSEVRGLVRRAGDEDALHCWLMISEPRSRPNGSGRSSTTDWAAGPSTAHVSRHASLRMTVLEGPWLFRLLLRRFLCGLFRAG